MDNNKLFAKDEDQNKLADFREILFTYLVYWKWFVLCAILSVGYTAFDLAQKNDVYNKPVRHDIHHIKDLFLCVAEQEPLR